MTSNRILFALVIALVCASFALGFVSSPYLKTAPPGEVRHQYLLHAGDAPPSVRSGVLAALRVFQEGYIKRDLNSLDAFMSRLFSESDDLLLLGTDANEWCRGYRAVREFIRADWLNWGDFRFAVDESIIWSYGDVAWITSVGMLRAQRSDRDRPVRFSAVLVYNGRHWLFRRVHFQWDERDPRLADLFMPRTYLKLTKLVLRGVRESLLNTADLAKRTFRWSSTGG